MKRKLAAFIREKTQLSDGFLKLFRCVFEIEKHEGGMCRVTREMMERGHAVAVLPYDPVRDEVVLVNEFRPGVFVAGEYPYTDNLVAGGIAQGESALDAAVRETQEEAGLALHSPTLIHPGAYVSSGGSSEKIFIVFGTVDTTHAAGGIHGLANESEDILAVVLPAQEFIDRAYSGAINDLKTCLAGYWLAEHRKARHVPPSPRQET
jgi:ADP-ribose pyrophosphatase